MTPVTLRLSGLLILAEVNIMSSFGATLIFYHVVLARFFHGTLHYTPPPFSTVAVLHVRFRRVKLGISFFVTCTGNDICRTFGLLFKLAVFY